jgi:DNA modification methylase
VGPRTPLSELNLNWRERDLPERERTKHVHRLHPYLGKYIPQLVEIFLRKYFRKGQTILDPFAGSGTTLVQANELGMQSVGYDISAFNVLLCRAKTAKYNLNQVRREINSILGELEPFADDLFATHKDFSEHPLAANQYLRSWYAPAALAELLRFRDLIPHCKNQDLLKVILCRAARSARRARHFDLDFPKTPQTEPYYCHKHRRTCQPTTDALKFLRRYALDTLDRVAEFSDLRTDASITIKHGDSRNAKFPPLDGVITSPPYVGLIDYHEQHTYAYHLLGLVDKRDSEIGPAAKGSSKAARTQYQQDIAAVFSHAAIALKPGGRIIVVVGDRANLYDEIRKLAGLKLEDVIQRHVNRRTGRRSSEFFESVLVWKK